MEKFEKIYRNVKKSCLRTFLMECGKRQDGDSDIPGSFRFTSLLQGDILQTDIQNKEAGGRDKI
ncbi:hypothetical protein B5E62_05810 [Lachnoclostridium sp. An118]|nr:hypothetical protein B5E62_05810 [Lachnoclostridium sp. An118]